jgi:hypothetical protein
MNDLVMNDMETEQVQGIAEEFSDELHDEALDYDDQHAARYCICGGSCVSGTKCIIR